MVDTSNRDQEVSENDDERVREIQASSSRAGLELSDQRARELLLQATVHFGLTLSLAERDLTGYEPAPVFSLHKAEAGPDD